MNLLELFREKSFEKKPNVAELEAIDGVGNVTAAQRDDAWKAYQAEQAEQEALRQAQDERDEVAAKKELTEKDAVKDQGQAQGIAPTHTVTVKKDGFRRLGRAWSGSEDVKLSAKDFEILEADPMFVVVAL